MPYPDPTPFITAFNAWDRNDLDVPPAAVRETSVQCLPGTPGELIAILPEAHGSFMRDACGPTYESLTFGVAETTTHFDPTADMLPDASETSAGQEAQTQAVRYFESRPITLVEVTGNDNAGDLVITLRIAHD
ncbi:MAG TPA: hypothetical protein VLS88_03600, partial [Polyangiales bacterium]|nr:hypothetical protein [Polyangiales bacterium]